MWKMAQKVSEVALLICAEKTKWFSTCSSTCHVKLLDMYIARLLDETKSKDCFYFTPLQKQPDDPTKPWFFTVPVGWNKLDRMVKEMFEEVNTPGKSNHSLRVTGATHMYKHGIQEKPIQSRTGHKSVEALRVYEWPGVEQHREAWEALADITNISAEKQLIHLPKSKLPSVLPAVYPCHTTGMSAQVPTSNFSGCSVNVFTGPVMTSGTFESHISLTKEAIDDILIRFDFTITVFGALLVFDFFCLCMLLLHVVCLIICLLVYCYDKCYTTNAFSCPGNHTS